MQQLIDALEAVGKRNLEIAPSMRDVLAFVHLRPILLAAGCEIKEESPDDEYECRVYSWTLRGAPYVHPNSEYALALSVAIIHLRDQERKLLRTAIKKVKGGAQ